VTGPNGVTRLEPKVMLVLACLAAHAGRMVPKDRLLHAAWPDTAVGDDVLTCAISELRRLFEDDPKQPRVIETIPKSGYRLIAGVSLNGAERDRAAPGHSAAGERVPAGAQFPRRKVAPSSSALSCSQASHLVDGGLRRAEGRVLDRRGNRPWHNSPRTRLTCR
jgi:DNA-binding winged helix-turn-helix (wHTH) protein